MIDNKTNCKNDLTAHKAPNPHPINKKMKPYKWRNKVSCVLLASLISLSSLVQPAHAVKIVVDAGHGGSDPGAIGVNGLQEKLVNLQVSLNLQNELLFRGYEVALTRNEDQYISLADRVHITNSAKADIFVSVHANANPSASVSGSQVLYHDSQYPQSNYPASEAMTALSPQSKKLAESVLRHVLLIGKLPDKGLVPSAAYVVRMGQIPSILVETAFLSNRNDAEALKDPNMLYKFAVGIANGIQDFLPPDSVPKPNPEPVPEPKLFADIQNHWAKEAILRLHDSGVIESDSLYNPDRPLTRAELLTMLNRKLNFGSKLLGTPKPGVHIPQFKDVPATHWATDIIYRAKALEYIDGYEDVTFRPDQSVTRAEVAVMLHRLMELPKLDKPIVETGYTDVPIDNWAVHAIVQLSQEQLLNGVEEQLFGPNQVMTRAQMAVLIDRIKEVY